MLNAEEAAARLGSLQDPQWRSHAIGRASRLPRKLRQPAQMFLTQKPAGAGRKELGRHHEGTLVAARALDNFRDGDRAKIMGALHPGLGPALARWWADSQGRPYGRRWDRRAFRTPHAPGLTAEPRAYELAALVSLLGPFDADPVWLAGWAAHLHAPGPVVAGCRGGRSAESSPPQWTSAVTAANRRSRHCWRWRTQNTRSGSWAIT